MSVYSQKLTFTPIEGEEAKTHLMLTLETELDGKPSLKSECKVTVQDASDLGGLFAKAFDILTFGFQPGVQ